MSDRGGHAPHLAIFSFHEFEGDPCVGDIFAETNRRPTWRERRSVVQASNLAGQGALAAERDSARESGKSRLRWYSFDLGKILARMTALGVEQLRVQPGFVAEEQKSLRIGIEPAQGINVFRKLKFRERPPRRARRGRELREDAVRFVKREQHDADNAGIAKTRKDGNAGKAAARARLVLRAGGSCTPCGLGRRLICARGHELARSAGSTKETARHSAALRRVKTLSGRAHPTGTFGILPLPRSFAFNFFHAFVLPQFRDGSLLGPFFLCALFNLSPSTNSWSPRSAVPSPLRVKSW